MVRAQWHTNATWYQTGSSPEREDALNWRLHKATSTGLLGEEGIHQIDTISNILRGRPLAVTGFSSTIRAYNDNREVPDTVQAVFEFPHGVNLMHDLTICNSFEKTYEVYLGDEAAMMMRDFKSWLFKEAGAHEGGWEVYARHDRFYNETGIALVAGASKQTTLAGSVESFNPYEHVPLYYALDNFVDKAGRYNQEAKDFYEIYPDGSVADLLEQFKADPAISKTKPIANWQDGLEATVMAIVANEAAMKRQRIKFEKEWFEL
jgi:predicted dehydrogenase